MHFLTLVTRHISWLVGLALSMSAWGEIKPETIGENTLGEPQASWVFIHDFTGPFYVFDVEQGEMKGLLSSTTYTPAVEVDLGRNQIFAAERYYSRLHRGPRTDVVTIYDIATLAPVAEIPIPDKIASLTFPQYISLLDDQKHLAVFNMTPGQSVSLVDVDEQQFVGEVSTPGCALIMPVEDRGFMQACGDGTLQLIRLDRDGNEKSRDRSKVFFGVDEDPIFDKPVPVPGGWLFISFDGQIIEAQADGRKIKLSKPWSILTDEEAEADASHRWRPGAGGQLLSYHRDLDLLFVLMHEGGVDTHEHAGSEVWVFNRASQRRIARIELDSAGNNLHVSQGEDALLSVVGEDGALHVYDVATTSEVRVIKEIGPSPGLVQGFIR